MLSCLFSWILNPLILFCFETLLEHNIALEIALHQHERHKIPLHNCDSVQKSLGVDPQSTVNFGCMITVLGSSGKCKF